MSLSSTALANASSPLLWQLGTSVAGGSDFLGAWAQNLAAGIVVSIVDEGVNYLHADLVGSYDTSIDYDPRDTGDNDAMPDTAAQHHGTEVASLIAGNIDNTLGAVGAAQGATITGSYLRLGSLYNPNDLDKVIGHQANYDVSNSSWGFTTAFVDNFHTGGFAPVAAALQADVSSGRDGLGTVMVFAAGNGKNETANGNIGDDANFHNFTNSRFTIAVGAHDQDGTPTDFSDPGTTVLLTAPGVSLLADDGTASGSTNIAYFTGTSGAAPLVSSAVALMLAANPDLGYRDVQEILAISATSRLGHSSENGFDGFNGGGLMFDRTGGFGMLDASAAVALARNWQYTSTFANEKELDFSFAPTANLDATHASLSFTLTPANALEFSTGHVDLDLSISDADLRDLQVSLISPGGTVSELVENLNQIGSTTSLSFTFGSVQFMGEDPIGTWTLQFSHATPSSPFTVSQADVHVYGDERNADDTYYYSSSYSALAATDATRMHAVDTDGGNDTLNFAAGDQKVILDLSGATASSFQNTPIYLDSTFENAIGTMYNDVLIGNDGNNRLVGDYGDDIISGAAGDDILLGGAGDDVLNGGSGSNTIDGGDGTDTAVYAGLWTDYSIAYVNGSYRVAHHGTSDVDTVTNVELFQFLGLGTGSLVDAADAVELAPTVVSIQAANSQTGLQGAARSIAVITAADEHIALGDRLVFTITNADGSPYHGDFMIAKTSATTAVIYTNDPSVPLNGSLIVTISDLAGDTVTKTVNMADFVSPGSQDAAPRTIETTLSSYTLAATDVNLTHVGSSDFTGVGNNLDNVLTGGTGNDILTGGAGNDVLVGGAGIDTAVYTGNRADYGIVYNASSMTLSVIDHRIGAPDGTDLLVSVEKLKFADGTFDGSDFASHTLSSVATHAADFDGDGNSSLLFVNNTTKGVGAWDFAGTDIASAAQTGTMTDGSHFAALGDFNGDGKTDVLLVNDATNAVSAWTMNGTQLASSSIIGTVNIAGGWKYISTADFNGDGVTDLLFQNTATHDVGAWQMNGSRIASSSVFGTLNAAAGWQFTDAADFNGDAKADLLFQNSVTHEVAIWQLDGAQLQSAASIGNVNAAAGWNFADIGDFNGDGKSDLLFINNATHGVAIWQTNGGGVTSAAEVGTMDAGWHFADVGDFNGDGKSDLLLLNDSTHGVAIWEMNGISHGSAQQIGIADAADTYVGLQDFNGDHKSDLLFENHATGALTTWEMNGTQIAVNQHIGTINTAADWHLIS